MPNYLFLVGAQTIYKDISNADDMRKFAMSLYQSYNEMVVVKYPWHVNRSNDYRIMGVLYYVDGDFIWAYRRDGIEYHTRVVVTSGALYVPKKQSGKSRQLSAATTKSDTR